MGRYDAATGSEGEFEPGSRRKVPRNKLGISAAVVHAELLLVHPFRDGNGRLARWLADLMFSQAGFPLPDYPFIGRGSRKSRIRYLNGVKAGYNQNYDLLAAFFAEAVTRGL